MEEKTVYSGVLTPTLKLLYTSAGEIQDNKDRIFKLIKRLSQTLNDSCLLYTSELPTILLV